MGDFGDSLRREREARGVALEAITKVTKISNRHLLALEQEHFDVLPGGVFNRGIVRGYARVVGLNEEEWLERYMSAFRQNAATGESDADWTRFAENASKQRESAEGRRPDMRIHWTGIGLLLLFLAGLVWLVSGYVHRKVALSTHSLPISAPAAPPGAPAVPFSAPAPPARPTHTHHHSRHGR